MGFISKRVANYFRRDIYGIFLQELMSGFSQHELPEEHKEYEYGLKLRSDPSRKMFFLGMVFGVGDQQSKQLALRDVGLAAPPLEDMDFARGHDHAVETYNKIRRGEIRYNG
jgi:hypothetical protein